MAAFKVGQAFVVQNYRSRSQALKVAPELGSDDEPCRGLLECLFGSFQSLDGLEQ